ncbi:YbgC/FadM family acyl-CoA thioesterase [Burkholderia ubonensis]|uniref:YbgC/FadM family acyl-CoA thioesterase n=1 Tax=Burkholderia ubonensis TaxID=101571 RepID=UPI0009B3F137|nr:YbgC/FadM family acyl-CoA thioesterase [Burkholderia ubonensis]
MRPTLTWFVCGEAGHETCGHHGDRHCVEYRQRCPDRARSLARRSQRHYVFRIAQGRRIAQPRLGPVEAPVADRVERRHLRWMTPAALQAFACMQQAIDDARLPPHLVSNERTGVIVGNACGVSLGHVHAVDAMRTRGLRGVGAYDIVHSMPSVHAACLAVAFDVRGACAASAQCIGHAVELIRAGTQDIVFADVDLGGVVYHANYMRYFDQARMEWYRANGIDLAHMMAEQNIGLIVCRVETDFVSPARHDEPLTIRTTLAELKRVRIVFEQEIYRDDTLVAKGRTGLAGVRLGTLRPVRIPFAFNVE